MKLYLRILLLLMAAVLALSVFVGCDTSGGGEDGTREEETDDPTSIFPDVERKDYGEDFYIYVQGYNSTALYYMDEEKNSGSPIDEAVYRRQDKVEKYLGIDVIQVSPGKDNFQTYHQDIQTAVQSMDGSIEVVITHVTLGIATLISDNMITDMSELEGINLDADYWNMDFMNRLELNGSYFLGLSDYNIINTYVIAFNKDLLAKVATSMEKSIYDTVKDKEWTIDKMIELASLGYADTTGDGKTADDTFGITGVCSVAFCGFLTASNIPMMEQDQSGVYRVAINQSAYFEKTDTLVEKLKGLATSNYANFDYGDTTGLSIPLSSGRTLMQMARTLDLSGYLSYKLEFGVLPYPMYDLNQASVGYRSLQWGGYIGVLSYLKNPIKVGEALEMLAFYSENVRITYYEKLLGKQVANMPDDVAMFDIVWAGLTTDVGQTFLSTSGDSKGICYTVPDCVNPSQTGGIASYMARKESVVNEGFRKFLEGIG